MMFDAKTIVRFEAKVDRSGGEDACHIWKGAVDPTGYGRMWNRQTRKPEGAHRLAYRIANGVAEPLDHNDDVVQTCEVRLCVNPRHLEFRPFRSAAERFWDNVDKNGPVPVHVPNLGPCWVWTASVSQRGYGQFSIDHHGHVRATRYVWFLEHGEMPPPHLFACHHCDNPRCVRPSHLFLGTHDDNVRDAIAKGRHINCHNGNGGAARPLIRVKCPTCHWDTRRTQNIPTQCPKCGAAVRRYAPKAAA